MVRISYDESKRARTLAERGLDFESAAEVFADVHLTRRDDRFDYGEQRWITIGSLGEMAVVLVWTEREESRRIISMRKADRDERAKFTEQQSRLDRP